MWLTFDWDNRGLEDIIVQRGLKRIAFDFPNHDVYYRVSSGGNGIHAFVAAQIEPHFLPLDLPDRDVLDYRQMMVDFGLEDPIRLDWDKVRSEGEGRTGRIFWGKSGNKVGEWVKYAIE